MHGLLTSEAPLRRFYRGIGPALSEQMLNRFMLFGVGAFIKGRVPAEWPEPIRDAMSGATAALVKTSVLHPLDTVKCRWQLGMPWDDLHGLYRGLGPATVRSSCGMAVWLASRNQLERTLPEDTPTWVACRHFIAGALSSALTDLCTFPFDTLKKGMQASSGGGVAATLLAEARRLHTEGGLSRFYAGYVPRLFMISINGALFNATFVALKTRLEESSLWDDL